MSSIHRIHDFLREEGLYEDAEETAIRRVIAWQLQQEMETKRISKSEMARRMGTSRSQLDRLLTANDRGITLETIERGARAVGRRVRLELV
jgi:antitoxin HicB